MHDLGGAAIGIEKADMAAYTLADLIGSRPANADSLADPTAWTFKRKMATRFAFDPYISLGRVHLESDPTIANASLHPLTYQSGSGFTLTYASASGQTNGQLTLANALTSGTNEVVFPVFGLVSPCMNIEVDVAAQSVGNVNIDIRKDSNNRLVYAFKPNASGAPGMTGQAFLAGVGGSQTQFNTNLSGVTPVAPYTIILQVARRQTNVFVKKDGVITFVGFHPFSTQFDLGDPTVRAGFTVHAGSRTVAAASSVTFSRIEAKIAGIGQADPRIVSFEDGSPIVDREGRVYLLMTTRGNSIPDAYQGVYRLNPQTLVLEMVGQIFGDRGDGIWRNDNAGHLFYDRNARKWRLILVGHSDYVDGSEHRYVYMGETTSDPRFGRNVVGVSAITLGDPLVTYEDFHCIYDAAQGLWVATASKNTSISSLLTATNWNGPYTEVTTAGSGETGNLIVKANNTHYVLAGANSASLNIRSYSDLSLLGTLSYTPTTGGSRIWPAVFAHSYGGISSTYLLTFDRGIPAGPYSYGGLYLYRHE